MTPRDRHHLKRFVAAQVENYPRALLELQRGHKESHWMWYIFPQVAGLGSSPTAQEYAIRSRDEGIAYLAHTLLGTRLRQCCEALLKYQGRRMEDILGLPDDLKLRSSMTLFAALSPSGSIFHEVLDAFYSGEMDERTLAFLNAKP